VFKLLGSTEGHLDLDFDTDTKVTNTY